MYRHIRGVLIWTVLEHKSSRRGVTIDSQRLHLKTGRSDKGF